MKRYLFTRKRYGWGWTPATWQGWSVLLFFIVLITLNTSKYGNFSLVDTSILVRLITETGVLAVLLIGICCMAGETPRWQWGEKSDRRKRKELRK